MFGHHPHTTGYVCVNFRISTIFGFWGIVWGIICPFWFIFGILFCKFYCNHKFFSKNLSAHIILVLDASEVTTLWHYTNLFIIIILIFIIIICQIWCPKAFSVLRYRLENKTVKQRHLAYFAICEKTRYNSSASPRWPVDVLTHRQTNAQTARPNCIYASFANTGKQSTKKWQHNSFWISLKLCNSK